MSCSLESSLINFEQEQEHEQETVEVVEEEREEMFEKPLTPSDVGKLNRLVIPKQQAEKYFPLGDRRGRVDSLGSLLSFEDESGKSWRFRYSYWNSSQSYVLTKGWSRFVKEKQLNAGDVVLFQRRRGRFFIRWRRGSGLTTPVTAPPTATWTQLHFSTPSTTHLLHQPPLLHHSHYIHADVGVALEPVVETQQRGGWKRLRLFGVNLECQLDETETAGSSPFVASLPSQGQTHLLYSQAHGSSHAYLASSQN